jgi:hypothetical protein
MITKKILLVLIASLLCLSKISFSQDKAEKINDLLNRYNQYGLFNGSALVAENGKVILKNGYGFANMESSKHFGY